MNTTQALAEKREQIRTHILTPEELRVMDGETERLITERVSSRILSPGQTAPDFILPDHRRECFRLACKLKQGPVVVVFYRGGWCPYCNLHLRGFEGIHDQIRETGASLIAVSPQLPAPSLETAEKNALSFPVLSDVGNLVAEQFGLVFPLSEALTKLYRSRGHLLADVNGQDGPQTLPMPGTFVIAQDRTVLYAQAEADYTLRAEPEEVLSRLRHHQHRQI